MYNTQILKEYQSMTKYSIKMQHISAQRFKFQSKYFMEAIVA